MERERGPEGEEGDKEMRKTEKEKKREYEHR